MLKRGLLVLSVFLCLVARVRATDIETGPLVDCGTEKVVLFNDTTSEDGRYALAWTIRPNQKKEPVDWSSYRSDDFVAFSSKYRFFGTFDEPNVQDYQLVNGVVDLAAKRFTPLPSKDPYYPNRVRAGISAVWSADRHGTRYAVVSIETQLEANDLWLLTLDTAGPRPLSLIEAANKAVTTRMRKRHPDDDGYVISYIFNDDSGGITFRKDSVTVPFLTAVYKIGKEIDQGYLTFALPRGKILRLGFHKK